MDEDLTASHWDDVLSPSQINEAPKLNSFFDSLHIDDPHKDVEEDPDSANEEDRPDDHSENPLDGSESYENQALGHTGFAQDTYNQAERDQLEEMRRQQQNEHKSSLLSALTSGQDELDMEQSLLSPSKKGNGDELFQDKGSPLKLASLSASETTADAITSPVRSGQLKNGKFKATRGRKYPPKTIQKHFGGTSSELVDPLSFSSEKESTPEAQQTAQDKTKQLLAEAESPLYGIAQKPTEEQPEAETHSPTKIVKEEVPNGNSLEISVADPLKVGDITTAHIVYGIKTRNKNSASTNFPQVDGPVTVSRRYRDFRWIYHQLENNHPGKIIPPPPSKQTYIGRFNENFIENRRLSLEKMLTKISKIPQLANDPDFVMFLTSDNFANDSKEREQLSGSGASVQANSNEDDEDKGASTAFVSGATTGGFMSSLFSIPAKHQEPDEFFSKKKGYIDDLEHNLRTFYKSLELIASQRIDIASVVEEIAAAVSELADLEISKTTSDLLNAFSEVHLKLEENLDRVNLQDQLTLGFTIEEYLRIIGSVKHTFETRTKVYQQLNTFQQELARKEESLERLTAKYKSSVDKINQLQFEVDKLKQRVEYFENSFKTISETIKDELHNFEMEKIEDFRNSVEIFIESSIESQKEAIELWETFYERQKLASV